MKVKSFELDPRVPLSEAVQNTALDELDKGAQTLEERPQGLEEAIHEFRKSMKRVRGLLRLVRPVLGEEYPLDNAVLRDAAREFADLRDRTVLVETLEGLAPGASQDQLGSLDLARQIFTEREAATFRAHAMGPRIQRALKGVSEVCSRVVYWEVSDVEVLEEGFEKTYQRARKRYVQAVEGDWDHLHDFRKRAKYHRYHLRLLRPFFRKAINAERRTAKELSDLLGDQHDLEVLLEELRSVPKEHLNASTKSVLEDLIQVRRRRLVERALELGQLVFAEKTKQRGKRIKHYLTATRKKQVA